MVDRTINFSEQESCAHLSKMNTPHDALPAPKQRVLFVDDEEGIRLTLPPILEGAGFDVTVAASLPEALDVHSPVPLFIDGTLILVLPLMDSS